MDCGEAAAEWFSELLGVASRLVRMPAGEVRRVDRRFAGPSDQVSFADGFPFLLVSEESVRDLNARMERPVALARIPHRPVKRSAGGAGDGGVSDPTGAESGSAARRDLAQRWCIARCSRGAVRYAG